MTTHSKTKIVKDDHQIKALLLHLYAAYTAVRQINWDNVEACQHVNATALSQLITDKIPRDLRV